jgi:hypothetical protein
VTNAFSLAACRVVGGLGSSAGWFASQQMMGIILVA